MNLKPKNNFSTDHIYRLIENHVLDDTYKKYIGVLSNSDRFMEWQYMELNIPRQKGKTTAIKRFLESYDLRECRYMVVSHNSQTSRNMREGISVDASIEFVSIQSLIDHTEQYFMGKPDIDVFIFDECNPNDQLLSTIMSRFSDTKVVILQTFPSSEIRKAHNRGIHRGIYEIHAQILHMLQQHPHLEKSEIYRMIDRMDLDRVYQDMTKGDNI